MNTAPLKCAVPSCENYQHKTQDVTYHRFPKDVKLRRKWTTFCGLSEKFKIGDHRICSDHFEADCYVLDFDDDEFSLKKHQRRFMPDGEFIFS